MTFVFSIQLINFNPRQCTISEVRSWLVKRPAQCHQFFVLISSSRTACGSQRRKVHTAWRSLCTQWTACLWCQRGCSQILTQFWKTCPSVNTFWDSWFSFFYKRRFKGCQETHTQRTTPTSLWLPATACLSRAPITRILTSKSNNKLSYIPQIHRSRQMGWWWE